MKKYIDKIRLAFQIIYTVITNGYLYGFLSGKIYRGSLKYVCVPGLNCYSCPGALGSCPIGALQALLNRAGYTVPFAALGFFFVFGSLFGRFVCGWLCPFGLLQDLLYKIPLFHKLKQLPHHKFFSYGRYLVLVFLIAGSLFLFGGYVKVPAFCKFLCPSGTFFAAIPLLAVDKDLRGLAGGLFFWKFGILILIILAAIKVCRPFCQYLCPLGAIYGWFNRFSLMQINWMKDDCTHCGACTRACPFNLAPEEISVSSACIRCGKCIKACPNDCVCFGTVFSKERAGEGVTQSIKKGNV